MFKELIQCYGIIDESGKVLDVGCAGFGQFEVATRLGLTKLKHFGVDYCKPEGEVPPGFVLSIADLNSEPIPFESDMFDLVVASHIIEHLSNPVDFFIECVRVCKPSGIVYFEAPSERSLLLPGMPFAHDKFFSLSFFDDPTHISRPWTPQAFYRMAKYVGCEPVKSGYIFSWKCRALFPLLLIYALLARNGKWLERSCWLAFGWASYLVLKKPVSLIGKPSFNYYIPRIR